MVNWNVDLTVRKRESYRDEGQAVSEAGVLQLATQRGHVTAVGGDFLLQPIDPGAAGETELGDGGQEALRWGEEPWRRLRHKRGGAKPGNRRGSAPNHLAGAPLSGSHDAL